ELLNITNIVLRREELEIITKEPLKTNLQELEQIRNIPTYKNKINSILEEARTLAAEER
ncbi:15163_t:CDS:1, partial [Racocetra persica]